MEAAGIEKSQTHKRCVMFWCWKDCVCGGEGEQSLVEDVKGLFCIV